MKLIKQQFCPNLFTLLTAPVASGKTRLVIEYYREENIKIVFVSPLRALATEVYTKLSSTEKNIFLAGGKCPLEQCMTDFLSHQKSFFVTTIELLSEDFIEACSLQNESILFIIDEFHLVYHWGETFRPILHDRFLAILDSECPILALTATMNAIHLEKLQSDLAYYNNFWIHLDFGNLKLQRSPVKIHSFYKVDSKFFYRTLWKELRFKNDSDVFIIFCAYRSEVDELVSRAERMGLRTIGCVGGEVESFLDELEKYNQQIDCIFSTTTLSHGVNLPEISKVFINYEVNNYDFWLQMVGRGGRLGADYEVYSCDSYHSDKKSYLINKMSLFWNDFVNTF